MNQLQQKALERLRTEFSQPHLAASWLGEKTDGGERHADLLRDGRYDDLFAALEERNED